MSPADLPVNPVVAFERGKLEGYRLAVQDRWDRQTSDMIALATALLPLALACFGTPHEEERPAESPAGSPLVPPMDDDLLFRLMSILGGGRPVQPPSPPRACKTPGCPLCPKQ